MVSATLLRFDVVVRLVPADGGPDQQLEQWLNLTFNPPGPTCWLDVTQQAAAPDLTRSLLLRADPAALADSGVFVPLKMDGLGTSAEYVDATAGSPPYAGVVSGDDDLSTFDPVALFLDPHLLEESVYDLIDDAHQYTVLSATPIQLTGIHSLIDVDEVAMISVPDATHLGWTTVAPQPMSPASDLAGTGPAADGLVGVPGLHPAPARAHGHRGHAGERAFDRGNSGHRHRVGPVWRDGRLRRHSRSQRVLRHRLMYGHLTSRHGGRARDGDDERRDKRLQPG